ncbi:Uncharacterized protein TCM_011447 [Theobroma cacao]|uniref:Uncharacterized protein n=1 Tax=Theobroma cacao TaxID=3641 RepID=A0A061EH09_THECC|nr:Uncharacterized protein TCM_011447 [Theobroma cacao]
MTTWLLAAIERWNLAPRIRPDKVLKLAYSDAYITSTSVPLSKPASIIPLQHLIDRCQRSISIPSSVRMGNVSKGISACMEERLLWHVPAEKSELVAALACMSALTLDQRELLPLTKSGTHVFILCERFTLWWLAWPLIVGVGEVPRCFQDVMLKSIKQSEQCLG